VPDATGVLEALGAARQDELDARLGEGGLEESRERVEGD